MINQYYFKRLKLFKLPYKILLSYHSPLGNTIKNWVSYRMLSNILIVRNDVHILNLGLTIIQLRKAVNALFYRIQARGTFVVYAQASNALKMNHDSVFVFVKSWLPGLITNYRQLSLSVAINRFHKSIINPYLSRTQLNAIKNVKLKSFLKIMTALKKEMFPRIPKLPSISFSVLDNFIWLNECHNLRIPSIQLCDTQSFFDQVTYPIVANQRSVPLIYLLIHLFSEVCNNALIDDHLSFIAYYKYLNKKISIKSKFKKPRKKYGRKFKKYKLKFYKPLIFIKTKEVKNKKNKRLHKVSKKISFRHRRKAKNIKKKRLYAYYAFNKRKIQRYLKRYFRRYLRKRKLKKKRRLITAKHSNIFNYPDRKFQPRWVKKQKSSIIPVQVSNHYKIKHIVPANVFNLQQLHTLKKNKVIKINTFKYDNDSYMFRTKHISLQYAKSNKIIQHKQYLYFQYIKKLLWKIIIIIKTLITRHKKFLRRLKYKLRQINRKNKYINYRYKKNNLYKKKNKVAIRLSTQNYRHIKKHKNVLKRKHLRISLRKTRRYIYKRFKASRNLLHHFIKKLLGRNDLVARKKNKRSRFVTFIRIYKHDIQNQYCLKFVSNPNILNKLRYLLLQHTNNI